MPESAKSLPPVASRSSCLLPALLAAFAIAAPLFLFAAAQMTGQNLRAFLARQEKDVVYRVVLDRDVREAAAQEMALTWAQSSDWASAKVIEPVEFFAGIEELKDWAEEPGARSVLEPMPYTVDLRPRSVLTSPIAPDRLAKALEATPKVERVFYDRQGTQWLRALATGMGDIESALRIALGVMALGVSLLAGAAMAWASRRASQGGDKGPALGWSVGLVLCSSGLLALGCAAAVWGYVYTNTLFMVAFLSVSQALALALGGALCGALAWAVGRWAGRGRCAFEAASSLLVLGVLVSALAGASWASAGDPQADSAPSSSTRSTEGAPQMALPAAADQAPALGSHIVVGTAREREAALERNRRETAKVEETIGYLEAWLQRAEEDRQLDAHNRELNATKLEAAQGELVAARSIVTKRQERLQAVSEALNPARHPGSSPALIANGSARSRREVALFLLAREAQQTIGMAPFDTRTLAETSAQVDYLQREAERLSAFERHARQSPEDFEAERERLRERAAQLRRVREEIEQTPLAPKAPPPSPTPTPPPPLVVLPPSVSIDIDNGDADLGYNLFRPAGTLIRAVAAGTVLHAAPFKGLGSMVSIDHGDGLSSLYAHLADGEIAVEPGQEVKAGQYIGAAGVIKDSGRQGIRFEVRRKGKRVAVSEIQGVTRERLDALLVGRQ